MGRIEEALRRSTLSRDAGGSPAAVQSSPDVFVSPWGFRDGHPRVPADTEPERPEPVASAAFRSVPLAELHGLKRFSGEWLPRLVIGEPPNHQLVEQFRQLAASLHAAQVEHNVRVLMVTSAEPNEGKSLTSVNLALTFSESYGFRVLLLDADLRRPSLHQIAQVSNATGLGEMLKASGEYKLPLFQLSERLTLAPAGRPDPNPMGALTSPRMRDMLTEASSRFDWVILDAPPLGPIADSSLLAPLCDIALLVVRARQTHYASVQKAVDVIGRERVFGVVLNDAELPANAPYRGYYAAYRPDDAGA